MELPRELIVDKSIKLRQFTIEDNKKYFECQTSKEAQKGYSYVLTDLEDSKKELQNIINEYNKEKPGEAGFCIEVNKEFAGVITLETLGRKRNEHSCNLAYAILPKFMNQGITTKSIQRISQFAFEDLKLIRIEASCKAENIGSYRVLEKSGFTLEGIHRKSHRYEVSGICDERYYALLKEDIE